MKKKVIIVACFGILIIVGLWITIGSNHKLISDSKYPRWLKSGKVNTLGTSGITFVKEEVQLGKMFFICDDSGELYRFYISVDDSFSLNKLYIPVDVRAKLSANTKIDFEEIAYDRHTNTVYVSIEGNGTQYKEEAGIYRIVFNSQNIFSDSVLNIEKLNIQPETEFMKYVQQNVAFEGFTMDSKYFYAGLEGFQNSDEYFADSTLIYVINKTDLKIEKIISTKRFEIGTITGLHSDGEKSLWGVDRNIKGAFHLQLNEDFSLKNRELLDVAVTVPNYKKFTYGAAIESITLDKEGTIYICDDPYAGFFIPSKHVLNKFDYETKKNFATLIPIIFKFRLN